MASWRTTVAGISLAFGLLLTQLGSFLDDDPNTKPDWSVAIGAVVAIGGAVGLGATARDNSVSSEDAGVK